MGQGKSKGSANVAALAESDVASVTTAGSVSDLGSGKKRKKWRRKSKAGYSLPDDRAGSSLTLAGCGTLDHSDEAVLVSYRDKRTMRLRPPQRTQSMALPQNMQPDFLRPSSEERSLHRPRRAPSAAAEVMDRASSMDNVLDGAARSKFVTSIAVESGNIERFEMRRSPPPPPPREMPKMGQQAYLRESPVDEDEIGAISSIEAVDVDEALKTCSDVVVDEDDDGDGIPVAPEGQNLSAQMQPSPSPPPPPTDEIGEAFVTATAMPAQVDLGNITNEEEEELEEGAFELGEGEAIRTPTPPPLPLVLEAVPEPKAAVAADADRDESPEMTIGIDSSPPRVSGTRAIADAEFGNKKGELLRDPPPPDDANDEGDKADVKVDETKPDGSGDIVDVVAESRPKITASIVIGDAAAAVDLSDSEKRSRLSSSSSSSSSSSAISLEGDLVDDEYVEDAEARDAIAAINSVLAEAEVDSGPSILVNGELAEGIRESSAAPGNLAVSPKDVNETGGGGREEEITESRDVFGIDSPEKWREEKKEEEKGGGGVGEVAEAAFLTREQLQPEAEDDEEPLSSDLDEVINLVLLPPSDSSSNSDGPASSISSSSSSDAASHSLASADCELTHSGTSFKVDLPDANCQPFVAGALYADDDDDDDADVVVVLDDDNDVVLGGVSQSAPHPSSNQGEEEERPISRRSLTLTLTPPPIRRRENEKEAEAEGEAAFASHSGSEGNAGDASNSGNDEEDEDDDELAAFDQLGPTTSYRDWARNNSNRRLPPIGCSSDDGAPTSEDDNYRRQSTSSSNECYDSLEELRLLRLHQQKGIGAQRPGHARERGAVLGGKRALPPVPDDEGQQERAMQLLQLKDFISSEDDEDVVAGAAKGGLETRPPIGQHDSLEELRFPADGGEQMQTAPPLDRSHRTQTFINPTYADELGRAKRMLPRIPGAQTTPKFQTAGEREGQDDSGFLDFRSKEEVAVVSAGEVRASPVGANNRKTSVSANYWVGMDELEAPAAAAAVAAPLRKTSRNHDEQPVVGTYSAAASDSGKASRIKRHSAPPGSLDNLSFENFGKKQRASQST